MQWRIHVAIESNVEHKHNIDAVAVILCKTKRTRRNGRQYDTVRGSRQRDRDCTLCWFTITTGRYIDLRYLQLVQFVMLQCYLAGSLCISFRRCFITTSSSSCSCYCSYYIFRFHWSLHSIQAKTSLLGKPPPTIGSHEMTKYSHDLQLLQWSTNWWWWRWSSTPLIHHLIFDTFHVIISFNLPQFVICQSITQLNFDQGIEIGGHRTS